jgi:putative adhesin
MKLRRLAAALVLLASVPARARADDIAVERDNVDLAPKNGVEIHSLTIDNRLGDITVEGRDAPGITLSVVKRAPDEETLERLKVNLSPDPSGEVSISSALLVGQEMRPIAAGQVRIDIHVAAPRTAKLQVKSWDGKISVTGMSAGATLAGHEADITVDGVRGLVTTTGMRGRQRLSRVDGSVDADAIFGDVDLDGISGDSLAARVHRGTVLARHVRSMTVKITTTFGDIRFRGQLLAGARVELRSFRGNVESETSGAFQVDAWARDGRVDPRVELSQADRPELGRIVGSYGSRDQPALLILSAAAGRVVFGLITE